MNKVYIVSAKRTPMGSFGGQLKGLSAVELGSLASMAALTASGIPLTEIDEVFFGNVCSANLGQAPARQVSINAGLSNKIPCTTINKVCSSGLKSIMLGAQSIMTYQNRALLVGGTESMSNIPYYMTKFRWGKKFGGDQIIDGLQKDGLVDAYNHNAMGVSGDMTADRYGLTRNDLDDFAVMSYTRAAKATEEGRFENEIVPVELKQRKGGSIIMKEDEEYKNVNFDKIPQLRPAFNKDGTCTAANSSTLNDGASALVVVSEAIVNKFNLSPLAEIMSFADAAHEPEWFTTAPTLAAPKALKMAGLGIADVEFFEVNEAFSSVALAFSHELKVDLNKMNVNGGAVALGHPLGSSGSRIVVTLLNVLKQNNAEIGCATLCNGGGGASAIVIKNMK